MRADDLSIGDDDTLMMTLLQTVILSRFWRRTSDDISILIALTWFSTRILVEKPRHCMEAINIVGGPSPKAAQDDRVWEVSF
jgi:hypothetical protein